MSFMRLGTRVAVINEKGEILLSKRGDFGTWALPGGRVDSGELLHESAIREVREETGLEVQIERAVGLYYQEGRSRTNILYRAKPVGGELFDKTDETLANEFFAPDNLPENIFGKIYIDHAYTTKKTYIHTVETPRRELIKLDLKLRWRWIQNLLSGKPEPKFQEFQIFAVAIVVDTSRQRIIGHLDEGKLPRSELDGQDSIEDILYYYLPLPDMKWEWVGLWQDTKTNTIEFIFLSVGEVMSNRWASVRDLTLERDRQFMEKIKPKHHQKVWLIEGEV